MLRPGECIGDWVAEKPLGEGGMGAVYLVHSALTRRLVAALKVMKPSGEPDARARFVREAEALAALRHPAVVRVMEFAEDDERDLLYLVMELAVGETLRAGFERGPMTLHEALAIFVPLAQGLDHAHQAGVFHRDIKPSNVILCEDGSVRLVDFGIAAARHAEPLTNTGQLGTLTYLPPEVFKGERPQPAALDVYALGLLMHEALTGVRSFPVDPSLTPAAAAAAVGVRKLQAPALELPESFPERLRDLVRRATDPDPAARPSMHEIRERLESVVERRGASDSGSQRLVPLKAAAMAVPDEATTRVPDPAEVRLAGRGRMRIGRQLLTTMGLAAALMMAGTALFMAGRSVSEPAASAATATAGGQPESRSDGGTSSTERPRGATPAVPSSPVGPDPLVSPFPRLSVPPGASPPTGPTPAGVAPADADRQPPEVEPAQDADSQPEPAEPEDTAPSTGETEGGADVVTTDDPSAQDFAGRWELTNQVEATSQPEFAGMRLGYRLTLAQEGGRVYGRGRKYSENGVLLPPSRRTAISVEGRIEGQYLILQFTEHGAWRTSTGTMRWLIGPGGALHGRFASDAAESRGVSSARRLR